MNRKVKQVFLEKNEPKFESGAKLEETLQSLLSELGRLQKDSHKKKYPPRRIRKKGIEKVSEKIEILELPFTF